MPQLFASPLFAGSNQIPAGAIVIWDGTIATIPTDWVFCDGTAGTPDLRDKYVIGAGTGFAFDSTGGVTSGQIAGTTSQDGNHGNQNSAAGEPGAGASIIRAGNAGAHGHSVVGDMDWEPPSREIVYIRAAGDESQFPLGSIVWRNDASIPTGFTQFTAGQNNFMLGQTGDSRGATGSDSRAITASVASAGAHVHPSGGTTQTAGSSVGNVTAGAHTHPNVSESLTVSKPPYYALTVIQASADEAPADGIVIIYDGALGNLPSSWLNCDGAGGTPDTRDRIPLGAGGTFALGATGGATTDNLSGGAITSVSPSHDHEGQTGDGAGGDHDLWPWTHGHVSWSQTGANVMPPYHTLYLIMFTG